MSIAAVDKVMSLYQKSPGDSFYKDLMEHFRNGFVISLPGNFLMAKLVEIAGRRAWLVHIASGELKTLLRMFPVPAPYIAFHRKGKTKIKIYDMQRLTRKAR